MCTRECGQTLTLITYIHSHQCTHMPCKNPLTCTFPRHTYTCVHAYTPIYTITHSKHTPTLTHTKHVYTCHTNFRCIRAHTCLHMCIRLSRFADPHAVRGEIQGHGAKQLRLGLGLCLGPVSISAHTPGNAAPTVSANTAPCLTGISPTYKLLLSRLGFHSSHGALA